MDDHTFSSLVAEKAQKTQELWEQMMMSPKFYSAASNIDGVVDYNAPIDFYGGMKRDDAEADQQSEGNTLQIKAETSPLYQLHRNLSYKVNPYAYTEYLQQSGRIPQEICGYIDPARMAYLSMMATLWQNHIQNYDETAIQVTRHHENNVPHSQLHLHQPYLRNPPLYYPSNTFLPPGTHFQNSKFLSHERNVRAYQHGSKEENGNDSNDSASDESEITREHTLSQETHKGGKC